MIPSDVNDKNCPTILFSCIVLKEHASIRVDVHAGLMVQVHCPTTKSSIVHERAVRCWVKSW